MMLVTHGLGKSFSQTFAIKSTSPLSQSHFIRSSKLLIFSASKTTRSNQPFDQTYLKNSTFPLLPYQHPSSPYVNEFPEGVVPNIQLHQLHNNPGAHVGKKILGRGIGCKKGKTSGRGHKGQRSRSDGGTRPGFEGGVPFYKRVRKMGFSNAYFKKEFEVLNLDRLQYFLDSGRLVLPVDRPVNIKDLKDAGVLTHLTKPVKLLGEGKATFKGPKDIPLHIEVQAVSKDARDAVEANGGKVTTVYFNRLGLNQFLRKPLDQIKIKFAKCVKHPERYDFPRFIPYHLRSSQPIEENTENDEDQDEEEAEEDEFHDNDK